MQTLVGHPETLPGRRRDSVVLALIQGLLDCGILFWWHSVLEWSDVCMSSGCCAHQGYAESLVTCYTARHPPFTAGNLHHGACVCPVRFDSPKDYFPVLLLAFGNVWLLMAAFMLGIRNHAGCVAPTCVFDPV
jgi:hypothetical protein